MMRGAAVFGVVGWMLLMLAPAPAAAASKGVVRGTVRAPVGLAGLQKTFVVACWAPEGRCQQSAPQTKATVLEGRGPEASFEVGGLEPGQYLLIALRDVNANGAEDAGDWAGHAAAPDGSPRIVKPGERVEIALSVVGAPKAPGKGGLSGIYLGVKRSLVAPGPGSFVQQGITWVPEQDWITFFPDGRVYAALPPEGLGAPFDWSNCGADHVWCPTYAVSGSEVRVSWPGGHLKRFTRQKDGALRHEGVDFIPLAPLDGLVLEGRYQSVGNEYRRGFIVFAKDGTFEDRGFAKELDFAPGGRAGGTGRYVILRNTLELRYADGAVARTSVYALPDQAKGGRPKVLYVRAWDYHLTGDH